MAAVLTLSVLEAEAFIPILLPAASKTSVPLAISRPFGSCKVSELIVKTSVAASPIVTSPFKSVFALATKFPLIVARPAMVVSPLAETVIRVRPPVTISKSLTSDVPSMAAAPKLLPPCKKPLPGLPAGAAVFSAIVHELPATAYCGPDEPDCEHNTS